MRSILMLYMKNAARHVILSRIRQRMIIRMMWKVCYSIIDVLKDFQLFYIKLYIVIFMMLSSDQNSWLKITHIVCTLFK